MQRPDMTQEDMNLHYIPIPNQFLISVLLYSDLNQNPIKIL